MEKNDLSQAAVVVVVVIALIAVGTFAAGYGYTNQAFLGESNSTYDLDPGFTGGNYGFHVVLASTPASQQPCAWSNGTTCSTAITKNDFYYSLPLTLTAKALPSHTYTLYVQENTGTGYDIGILTQSPGVGYATLGTLTFTTPSTIVVGQSMTFVVDTPFTEYNAPVGMVIIVT